MPVAKQFSWAETHLSMIWFVTRPSTLQTEFLLFLQTSLRTLLPVEGSGGRLPGWRRRQHLNSFLLLPVGFKLNNLLVLLHSGCISFLGFFFPCSRNWIQFFNCYRASLNIHSLLQGGGSQTLRHSAKLRDAFSSQSIPLLQRFKFQFHGLFL